MSPPSPVPTPDFAPDGSGAGAGAPSSTLATRKHQMFPVLTPAELARLARFGTVRCWADGQCVFHAGGATPGMVITLRGRVRISRCNGLGQDEFIIEHGPGEFAAEVATLAGRPALVDGHAVGELEALCIPPAGLRALVIAEAELGERIMRALILRRVGLLEAGNGTPVLVAPPGHARLFALRSFLAQNGHPHTVLDPATSAQGRALVEHYRPGADELPLVVCPDGVVKRNPSEADLGQCLGMLNAPDQARIYDAIVVGAGPAGLATAVYAASEGLSVLVVERRSFGGQAGASARIENYLGFPTGISGRALAGRAFVQAQKFGADVSIPHAAARLLCDEHPLRVELSDGSTVRAHAVVLACGARYRKPPLADLERYEGHGVYYWAAPIEARALHGEEVVLVGGGNSAGQAAVFLASHVKHVHMLIRGAGLAASMSSYLIDRIAATPNITLHTHTQLTALDGDGSTLAGVRWQTGDAATHAHPVRAVFLFVGADPNTDWLAECGVRVDKDGFIETGTQVMLARCRVTGQMLNPDGSLHGHLETTVPGVFAIGDVRAGSTKRVAAAVGEGAAVVAQLHQYLAARVR